MDTLPVERVRVRVVRRRHRRWRVVRRVAGPWLLAVAAVVLVAVAWVVVRGIEAEHNLHDAAASIQQVRRDLLDADTGRASQDLVSATASARSADRETHDPVWALLGAIPGVGSPLRTTAGVASIAHGLTQGPLPALVRTAGVVSSQRVRIEQGSVDLTALGDQAAPLSAADTSVAAALDRADRLDPGWFGPVTAARARLVTQLVPLSAEVHDAAVTAQIGPAMLGADGVRTYFVAFQNDAEARGTGGIAGAYAILQADGGHLHVVERGSDADLSDDLPPVPVRSGLTQQFPGTAADRIWRNANVGAAFPDAATTWVALWQEQHHQQLDGAFAVDPTVLASILAVTGPATTSDGQLVTAQNAVPLTEQQVYESFDGQQDARKSFLQTVSSATIDKALAAPASDGVGLLEALRVAAGQRRLLLASSHADEQRLLATTEAGGVLPAATDPTAVMALVNASGNKIDYYVSSHLAYQAGSCDGTMRSVTVTATITNAAPTSGLPPLVTERLDGGTGPPGSEVDLLSYYATAGAVVESVTVDGAPAAVNASTDGAHPVFTMPLELLPGGATRTVVLHLREPVLAGPVQTRPQPLVQPQTVTVDAPVCGR